jgi:hypothetical protein
MVRSLLFTFALFLCSAAAIAQSTVLQGKVTDDQGETLIGATVKAMRGTETVRGAITDTDGNFRLQLDPGKYNLEVAYTGYATQRVTDVQVLTGKINMLDVTMADNSATVLGDVVITGYKVALVEQDKTQTGKTLTSEQIRNLPTRSVSQIVATTAGTTRSEDGSINIKGSRTSGTVYYLDGVRITGSLPPVQDLEQISVITGGLGAEYGDVTGGAISLLSKGPANEYHGAIELENSYYLDPYGWLLGTANISGPIVKRNRGEANETTLIGFRLSGQYWEQKDDDPPALPVYRPKESVLRRLEQNPVRLLNNTPIVAAEDLTTDSMDVLDYNPFEKRRDIDLTGKLDFRFTDAIDLSVTGTYKDIENQFTPGGWQVLNAQNNPTQYNSTYRGIARFRHRLGDDGSETAENASRVAIDNASYTIQGSFERSNGSTTDPVHGDRYFDYGYVGRFNYTYLPFTGVRDDSLSTIAHIDYQRAFTGYQPGYIDGSGNAVVPNPGLAAFNQFAINDSGQPGAIGTFLAQNGQFNSVYNNTWGGMWTNVNQVYNGVSKSENDILLLQATAGFDLHVGRSGTHNIQFGLLNEQRTNRGYNLSPFGLWQLADQLANSHIIGVDTNRIIGKYWDPVFSPLLGDSIDQYAARYVDQPGNRFYRAIREQLGLAPEDYVNVLSLSPDQLDLSMFSPRELLEQGFVNYLGYDYLGNKTPTTTTFNDFFSSTSVDGVRNFPVAPLRPLYQAAFISDKFSFNNMIFSLGVRVEQFDLNTRVMKDPYSLYQIQSARDFHSFFQSNKPENIGDDYKVYVEGETDPTVKAYRSGDTWYDNDGNQVNDPTLIFGGSGLVRPFLADTARGDDIFDTDFDPNTAFEDYTPQLNWLPRLAFSFPISKEANFFAHYDILVSRPPSNWQVTPLDYLYFYTPGRTPENNANLRPERVVDYEVGFQQLLNENSALKFSAYYREMRDMLQLRTLRNIPVIGRYTTFGNIDFGTVKGFTVQYDLRRIKNMEVQVAYTLQFAEGTGSNPETQRIFERNNIRTLYPLDFDERHNIQAIIDYRFSEGKGYTGPVIGTSEILANFGINMQISAVSGRPYTAQIQPVRFGGQGLASSLNGSRLPWRYNVDLRADKTFRLAPRSRVPLNVNVYFRVSNLLNTRNVVGVYRATGSPKDDGYLSTAEGQSVLRGLDESGRDVQAYLSSYAWRLQNSGFYTQPRRMYIGATLEF